MEAISERYGIREVLVYLVGMARKRWFTFRQQRIRT
jgi:hypothetical protein